MVEPIQLDPASGYFLVRGGILTDLDQRVLAQLYQPLLNPNAFTLYQALWAQVDDQALRSRRSSHFTLLELLGINPQEFMQARRQLEAVGLVRSFQTTDQIGDYALYFLYPPLAPADFFHEEILATFLLEKVSRKRYMSLVAAFALPQVDLSKSQETTAGFLDVFNLPSSALLTPPEEVRQGVQALRVKGPTQMISEISPAQLATFDWETLIALVGQKQIKRNEIMDHQSEIFGLHEFYEFSLTDIARLISKSLDQATNQIDFRVLEERALTLYDQLNPEESPTTTTPTTGSAVTTPPSTAVVAPAAPAQAFSQTDQDLLQAAKSLSLLPFTRWVKKQLGSKLYVGNREKFNLKTLQQRHIFSADTLNLLVWVCLQENPTVTVAPLDRIAQDWVAQKITTPEAGLTYYHQRQDGTAPTKSSQRRSAKSQGVVPSWLRDGDAAAPANAVPNSTDSTTKAPTGPVDDQLQQNLAWLKQKRQQRGDEHAQS
ncbi:DnaD domain protein [Lapidilactobacillus achengensis]|uniref:DnaD domain protein n=1 Tax=Lapidilactobacillus achengensis TaxID=2486000 RepID=A0ABW1UMT3_9LACO|nr:DnaD domain protein [Lapidilactobacillus achengensis]